MTATNSSSNRIRYVGVFFLYVLRRFPRSRLALALTALVLVLEYLSLSVMIPLAAIAGGVSGNGRVVALWSQAVHAIGLTPTLLTWVWLFLVMLALRACAGYGHQLLTTALSKQVHRTLSENVFARVLFDEPITQIYKRTVGFYISLAGDDTFRAGSMVNSALLFLAAAGSALCGLVLLLLFSRVAFGATVIFLALSAAVIAVCVQRMLRLNAQSIALSREAGTGFLEALNSLRSIRSMGSEGFAHRSYAVQMRDYTRLLFRVEALKNGIRFVPGIVALLTGIIILGPWWHTSLEVSGNSVFAATTILIRVFASLGALMTAAGTFLIDARAAKDLGELTSFDRRGAPTVTGPASDNAGVSRLRQVDLAGIHYAYEGGRNVLSNLTIRLERGRCYAVVGPSGSGKSTLADILLGIIEPSIGHVRVDGVAVDAQALRRRVVLVEQQPRIFSVSLRENLTLGLARMDEELMSVLRAVDLGAFVEALPSGLETALDYQGANLSGGQRQRLSIARALLRHPDVLILDEATSALDTATRDAVIVSLRKYMRDNIMVFITHDETVARIADVVLDLGAGAVTLKESWSKSG